MLEKTCELIQKVANMDELNTIIVVTHDVTAAASIADHICSWAAITMARAHPYPARTLLRRMI